MSDDSDSVNQKDKKLTNQRSSILSLSKSLSKNSHSHIPLSPAPVQDQTQLFNENRKLRKKLKQLSIRLDQQLQKAAENKLKQNNLKNGHPVSLQSQNLQLQNTYKMIERLQKQVHDYESKESYQITLKRVMDLDGANKKKEMEIEQLKIQVKTLKKINKDKEKHVEQLIENTKKMGNPAQDLEMINKLKLKLKKITEENDMLRKKQLEKHDKLIKAERRIIQLEQDQMPIGKQEGLLQQIEECKKKYKEAMQRVERQNIYISKLNQKLNKEGQQKSRKSGRISEKQTQKGQKRLISRSLQDLPALQKKINTSHLLEHLPQPKGVRLRRY